MESDGNTNEQVSQALDMPDCKPKAWEKNFSKRWKQPTKAQMVESIDVFEQALSSLSNRISQLETTTEKLIAYINQRIP